MKQYIIKLYKDNKVVAVYHLEDFFDCIVDFCEIKCAMMQLNNYEILPA